MKVTNTMEPPALERVRLLKIPEVVQLTGLSRTAIYGHIAQGRLRASKFGKSIRVRLPDLEEFIDEAARQ